MVPTSWHDEALARDGVSREVPCSALKGETGERGMVGYSPKGRKESDMTEWQPTPVFLPGESQGWWSLVGCCLWGLTELDMTEAT